MKLKIKMDLDNAAFWKDYDGTILDYDEILTAIKQGIVKMMERQVYRVKGGYIAIIMDVNGNKVGEVVITKG